ncbi:hypothetical protein ACFLYL_02425, partial [Chloroflexota bacterium]
TIDSSLSTVDGTTITGCTFNLDSPGIGVWIGGPSPAYAVSNVEMSSNTFNGPGDQISNPWKIGGWFGHPIACAVSGVEFVNNTVDRGSIPINLDDENIDGVLIAGNTFTNTDGVVYVWGEGDPTGVLSDFVFNCNDVDSTNSYGVGIDVGGTAFGDANFGEGNEFQCNNFTGIVGAYGFGAVSILSDLTSYTLDATKNWWGDVSGPTHTNNPDGTGSPISDNVVYEPWSYTPDPCEPKSKGFWKNHPDSLEAVLVFGGTPWEIGTFEIWDHKDAEEIFNNASGKYAENMLAAQLLAAELNAVHLMLHLGIDICPDVVEAMVAADAALASYNGPDSLKIKGKDKHDMLEISEVLDGFNNGELCEGLCE